MKLNKIRFTSFVTACPERWRFPLWVLGGVCWAIVFPACESTTELEVSPARAIIEAIMPVGEPIEIHVSKEILFKRDEADSIFDLSGLAITMNDGTETFMLSDVGDGVYQSERLVEIGKTYSLSFEYSGAPISSETLTPTTPTGFSVSDTEITIPPLTGGGRPTSFGENLDLKWTNTDGSSYLVVVENLESNPAAINTSGFARPSFRSEPLTADNYQVRATQFQYYGLHAVILFKVNPDYAALYEDPGDNSLTIKSPFTNVKNGLGIFTAVNSDTLWVRVVQ